MTNSPNQATAFPDALAQDTDHDGITDALELLIGTNPLSADTDRDGVRDGEELRLGLNPCLIDTDRDGILDDEDPYLGVNPTMSPAIDETIQTDSTLHQVTNQSSQTILDSVPNVSQLAQILGNFQGTNYAFAVEPGLIAITALDGRLGINGSGLIYQQYGDAVVSQLLQQDLNNFAQVQQHLAQLQTTNQQSAIQAEQAER